MRNGIVDNQHSPKSVFVIGNGPSSEKFIGVDMHPVIVCNRAHEDFVADHCVAVDRFAVAHINPHRKKHTTYWTKHSRLNLPAVDGWKTLPVETVDSGSSAIYLAHNLYPHSEIIAIGFDGVLGISNDNRYSYPFRNAPTPQSQRHKHRQEIYNMPQEIQQKLVFVN